MEISIDLTAVSIDLTSADSPSSSRKRYAEDFYESKLCSKEFPVQVQPESCTKKPALQVCNQARFQDATMLSWLLIEGDDIDTRQSPSDLEWKKIVEARVLGQTLCFHRRKNLSQETRQNPIKIRKVWTGFRIVDASSSQRKRRYKAILLTRAGCISIVNIEDADFSLGLKIVAKAGPT